MRCHLMCLPEFREYERASTVTLEAYVRPIMGRYITQLEDELPDNVGLRIMKSDGGVISAKTCTTTSDSNSLKWSGGWCNWCVSSGAFSWI